MEHVLVGNTLACLQRFRDNGAAGNAAVSGSRAKGDGYRAAPPCASSQAKRHCSAGAALGGKERSRYSLTWLSISSSPGPREGCVSALLYPSLPALRTWRVGTFCAVSGKRSSAEGQGW